MSGEICEQLIHANRYEKIKNVVVRCVLLSVWLRYRALPYSLQPCAESHAESVCSLQFMGMGEPLNNYDAVLTAIRAMSDGSRFNLVSSLLHPLPLFQMCAARWLFVIAGLCGSDWRWFSRFRTSPRRSSRPHTSGALADSAPHTFDFDFV